ncbi:MAG TPA: dephospho-CoA kinase [Rhodospirillaceae bacterium]|nr:dephospho-CoA kinase [Rhodospirillaceae bacterium]
MIVLGLTGSVGMGKTTAAKQLRRLKVPVFDADDVVHQLLEKGGKAVAPVEAAFPHVVFGGEVERARLGARVFDDISELHRLEAILHPLVWEARDAFLRRARRARHQLVVLDLPMLFETGADHEVDGVVVVSCPAFLQAARVLARRGMTPGKLAAIRHRQVPDQQKRRWADLVIETGIGQRSSLRQLVKMVRSLKSA